MNRAGKMMPVVRTTGILLFALAAGCAGVKDAPPRVQTEQLKVDPALVRPNPDTTVATAPLRFEAVEEATATSDVTLEKDLASVILLLGLPCGQVVTARRQADNDHIASCKDGNRYRVFVSAEGRAVAQKQ